jgi:hypothetical protein
MKVDANARRAIYEYMHNEPEPTTRGIVEILKAMADKPDPNELLEHEYANTARRYFTKIRDENGVREIYSTGDRHEADGTAKNPIYVDARVCDDLELIDSVLKQLKVKYEGIGAAIRKIEKRRAKIVAGQISLADIAPETMARAECEG